MVGAIRPIWPSAVLLQTDHMNLIAVRDLHKRYKEHDAVNGISFTVAKGECLSLLGPNGAGKTTTIEILEGFRQPTLGTVEVLGTNPATANPAWRNRVGVVLQSTFEASALTVQEELHLASTSYANPRPVDETLEMVGLTEKRRSRVARLSGGQRRRLDVALGIIGRPELLFLDEPTTGFDPSARLSFQAMISALHADGTTILLTTHYLEEAAELSDRVIVIGNGRIVAEGSPESLGGAHAHLPRVEWLDPSTGRKMTQTTNQPTELVCQLAAAFTEIPDLQVIRPTLEEVYLNLLQEEAIA